MADMIRDALVDVVIRGDFNASEVQLAAVSDLGREIMAQAYGFATIGILVRKSAAGGAIWQLRAMGAHVAPEAFVNQEA